MVLPYHLGAGTYIDAGTLRGGQQVWLSYYQRRCSCARSHWVSSSLFMQNLAPILLFPPSPLSQRHEQVPHAVVVFSAQRSVFKHSFMI